MVLDPISPIRCYSQSPIKRPPSGKWGKPRFRGWCIVKKYFTIRSISKFVLTALLKVPRCDESSV